MTLQWYKDFQMMSHWLSHKTLHQYTNTAYYNIQTCIPPRVNNVSPRVSVHLCMEVTFTCLFAKFVYPPIARHEEFILYHLTNVAKHIPGRIIIIITIAYAFNILINLMKLYYTCRIRTLFTWNVTKVSCMVLLYFKKDCGFAQYCYHTRP